MQIVKVRYYMEALGTYSSREYSYYSEDILQVGDLVNVPARDTIVRAQVSAVDVPESEVVSFKDKLKTIPAGALIVPEPSIPEAKPGDNWQGMKPLPTLKTAKDIIEKMPVIDDPVISEALRALEPEADIVPDATTAIILIHPESDTTILSLLSEANRLRDYAIARVITTDNDMSLATKDLSIIASIKKALTAKKDEYYKPVKAHLDAISRAFQVIIAPIEDADRITRDKWTAYRNVQEKRRVEAEAINRAKEELARREAELNHGEITVDLTPVEAPAPISRVQTNMGTAGITRNRKYRVVDFAKLPDQYKIENSALLNKVVKAGIPEIPGVEIYWEESLRVNTR